MSTFRDFRLGVRHLRNLGKTEVLREFKQVDYIPSPDGQRRPYTDAVQGGVCDALSLQWIAKCAREKDFWNHIKSKEGIDNTLALQKNSDAIVDAGNYVRDLKIDADAKARAFQAYRAKLRRDGSALPEYMAENMKSGMGEEARRLMARAGLLNEAGQQRDNARDNHRAQYLERHAQLLRRGDKPSTFASVSDACDQLVAFEGYAHIGAVGSKGGHGIAVYFSCDHVLVMDPNEGEIFADDSLVGSLGLEAHLQSLFKDEFLGDLKKITVDFYPFNLRPGQVDRLKALARGEDVADEMLETVAAKNIPQNIQNDNNAPLPDDSSEGGDSSE